MTRTLSQKLRRRGLLPRRNGRRRRGLRNLNQPFIGPRLPPGGLRAMRRRIRNPPVLPQMVPAAGGRRRRRRGIIGGLVRGAGSLVGSLLGQPSVGSGIGAGIASIIGQGDYMVSEPKANTLMNASIASGGPPAMSPLNSGVRVTHREYLRDLTSTTQFNSSVFPLNPGLPTFPWLSSVAKCFEEYKIHGMVFYLNTTSGMAVGSTNTALGYWGAVSVYDPADPVLATKQQCENYVGCQNAVVWKNLVHGIECAPGANVLEKHYIRTGGVPANSDIRFYDWGFTQVFTGGAQQAGVTLGELWVSYDIEFTKPRLNNDTEFTPMWLKFYNNVGVTPSLLAGTPSVQAQDGPLLTTGANFVGNVLNIKGNTAWPTGGYLLFLHQTYSSSNIVGLPTLNIGGPAAFTNGLDASTGMNTTFLQVYSTPVSNSVTSALIMWSLNVVDNSQDTTLTFTGQNFSNCNASTVWLVYMGNYFGPTYSRKVQYKLSDNELCELRELLALKDDLSGLTKVLPSIRGVLDSIEEEKSDSSDDCV